MRIFNFSSDSGSSVPLENHFPNIFTWVVEPKESSVPCIRKYLAKHHPELSVEEKPYRKAIEALEANKQLRRVTGKGLSGSIQVSQRNDQIFFIIKRETGFPSFISAVKILKD